MGQVVVMCKTAAGMATAGKADIHYQFVSIDMNLYIH